MSGNRSIALHKVDRTKLNTKANNLERFFNRELPIQDYQKQSLNSQFVIPRGFKYWLYYKDNIRTPDWKQFIGPLAKSGAYIRQKNNSKTESFLLLIKSPNNQYYFVTGGYGHHAIKNYTESDFGIDILKRIIDDKKDSGLLSVREFSPINDVKGKSAVFSGERSFLENEDYGAAYQEITFKDTADKLSTYFDGDVLSKKDTKLNCKSTFQIRKSVSIQKIPDIILGCEEIISLRQPTSISFFDLVDSRTNKTLVEDCNQALLSEIQKLFHQTNKATDLSVFHQEFEKFMEAESFAIENKPLALSDDPFNVEKLLKEIRSHYPRADIGNPNSLKALLSKKIIALDQAGIPLIETSALELLTWEHKLKSASYFYMNKSWFKINPETQSDLNQHCDDIVANAIDNSLLPEIWLAYSKKGAKVSTSTPIIKESENTYNSKYFQRPGYLVTDKVLPSDIEPCDVIKVENDRICLIHIKEGFAGDARIHCSQVLSAARMIHRTQKNGNSYLRDLFAHLTTGTATGEEKGVSTYSKQLIAQMQTYPNVDDFLNLFEKNIVFVFAFLPSKTAKPITQGVKPYKSNVAKISLCELSRKIQSMNFGFKITQIQGGVYP